MNPVIKSAFGKFKMPGLTGKENRKSRFEVRLPLSPRNGTPRNDNAAVPAAAKQPPVKLEVK
jgi:hypothetical protein